MKTSIITLLSGLLLSIVAEYYSIVGLLAIFPMAFYPVLAMGISMGIAKISATMWLKQNWKHSPVLIKLYLFLAIITLMIITSVGSFGFLSKAHLEQGASTIDNSAKIAQLQDQISREQSTVADDEKVIKQLDNTIDSYLGKDRADRSLTVRRSQAPQRKQLRDDIDATEKRIDALNNQKFQLESQVRKVQLDVGPIRYIAELFYGVADDATKNIESSVRIFTIFIVCSLDPFAIALLIASNHSLLRLQNEKEEYKKKSSSDSTVSEREPPILDVRDEEIKPPIPEGDDTEQTGLGIPINTGEELHQTVLQKSDEVLNEKEDTNAEEGQGISDQETARDIELGAIEAVSDLQDSVAKDISKASNNTPDEEVLVNEEENPIKAEVATSLDEEGYGSRLGASGLDISKSYKSMQETIREALNEKESISTETPLPIFWKTPISMVENNQQPQSDIVGTDTETEIPTEKVVTKTFSQQGAVYRELLGNQPHFIPQKANEDKPLQEEMIEIQEEQHKDPISNKYVGARSWLAEFKRS